MSECKKLEKCGHCACWSDLDYDFPGCQWCAMGNENTDMGNTILEISKERNALKLQLEALTNLPFTITVLEERLKVADLQNEEYRKLLSEIYVAGEGLFLVLDPRFGVGKRMSIVWDRLTALVAQK